MRRNLAKHDIVKLESYWLNYRELSASLESFDSMPSDTLKRDNVTNIIKAIETIYNDTQDTVRHVIDAAYFHNESSAIDSKHIADQVFCTIGCVNRIRESLMEETAAIIGWV